MRAEVEESWSEGRAQAPNAVTRTKAAVRRHTIRQQHPMKVTEQVNPALAMKHRRVTRSLRSATHQGATPHAVDESATT